MAKLQRLAKHTRRGWSDIREYITDPVVLREAERGWPDDAGIPQVDSSAAILAALNDVGSNSYYEKRLSLAGMTLGMGTAIKPNANMDSYVLSGGEGERADPGNALLVAIGTSYSPVARTLGGYARSLIQFEGQLNLTVQNLNFDLEFAHVSALDFTNNNHFTVSRCFFSRPHTVVSHAIATVTSSLTSAGLFGKWPSGSSIGTRCEAWAQVGSTLPTGYTAGTPYYISSSSGTQRGVSATLGGSTIVPSTTGSGTWGFTIGAPTITAVNTGTKTMTCVAHGLTVGMRVGCFNTSTLWTDSTGASVPFSSGYVIAVPTADTFQVSATPGGTAMALNSYVAGARIAPYGAAGIIGGGNQYAELRGNHFSALNQGIILTTSEAPNGVYVGVDTVTFSDNYYSSADVTISGRGNMFNDRYEGQYLGASLTIGTDSSVINLIGCYSEPSACCSPCISVQLVNYMGTITGCDFRGSGPSDGGSTGIRMYNIGSQCLASVFGNALASFETPGRVFGAGAPTGASKHPFYWGPNQTSNCATPFYYWSTQQLTDIPHTQNFTIFREDIGEERSLPIFQVPRRFVNGNPIVMDASWGNLVLSNNAQTKIDDVQANYYGYVGRLISENANLILGIGAFKTYSGADYYPSPGEVCVLSTLADNGNATTTSRKRFLLEQAPGAVVAKLQPGALSAGWTPTVFTGTSLTNINAGLYAIGGSVAFNTGGSAGTWKVTLSWVAPVSGAQSVDLVGRTGTTLANSWNATTTQIVTFPEYEFDVASGIPTLALAFTGLTGTPAFTPEFYIRRLR